MSARTYTVLARRDNIVTVAFPRGRRRGTPPPETPPASVVALVPRTDRTRLAMAARLFERATTLDENPATMREAEFLYREALRLDPTNVLVLVNLGNVILKREEGGVRIARRTARALYEHARRLDRWHPEALYNLGWIEAEERHWVAAWLLFEEAMATASCPPDLAKDAAAQVERMKANHSRVQRRRP